MSAPCITIVEKRNVCVILLIRYHKIENQWLRKMRERFISWDKVMRIMKRWLTIILAMSIALSDCGSITVFATEDAVTVETSDSGNDEESLLADEEEGIGSDELPDDNELTSDDETKKSEDADVSPEDANEDKNHEEADSAQDDNTAPETDTETELPTLHIGQIKKGEELPSPDDSEFVYDLPVSFEMSDSVLLFVNYSIDATFEKEEKGTLVWSILRGENGMEEGSTCLVNEEDDWADFEVVSDSPYFTMADNEDEESDYYQTVELAVRDIADDAEYIDYNYYIRAAWYFGTGEEKAEEFYAAATVAFLPEVDADMDETPDDALGMEEIDIEETQEDVPVTEETCEEEAADNALIEESYMNTVSEENDAENRTDERYESEEQQSIGKLVLYIADEDKPMEPGETRLITAKIESEDGQKDTRIEPSMIEWESSDKNVATVGKDGVISAKAEGYAQITAEYNDMMSYAMVEVACKEGTEKVLDLSGDIWVAGFQQESEDLVYTGQKITQDIRVYHNETLLKEKTDYTLTYKNNVNAAAYDSSKAPSVTIKLKGQYSGSRTLYFTIKPRNIDENGTMGYEQVVQYAKTLKIPAPTLSYNNKKLTSNKDFVCDYSSLPENYTKGDSYEDGEIYEYTVNGKGNFTGSITMNLAVIKDKNLNLGSATVTLDKKQYEYHGEPLSEGDVGITVKFGKTVVDENYYEYDVQAKSVGTGYVEIYPSNVGREAGYRGTKKVNIKVVGDRKIKDAVLGDGWQPSITFSQKRLNEDGGMIQAKEKVLVYYIEDEESDSDEDGEKSFQEEDLIEGENYTVKYSNHKKVGTATVTFTGKGRYTGSFKKTYKITPNNGIGKDENFTIIWKNVTRNRTDEGETFETAYQKGGAVPDFVLMYQDKNVLKNKTDYTVKLTNNKKAGSTMTCIITGKGNYKGYSASKQIMVTTADIGKGTISVADKQYSTKANAWKSKPTIKDVNGKTLAAGTDYAKEFEYTFPNMNEENVSYPEAGTTVTITVHGINNYEDSVIGSYRIYQNSISKLTISIDAQEYTGRAVELTADDIHVYANKNNAKKKIEIENKESCYKIVSYSNNIKSGTAKVTLQGIGDYGGTKTYSFKISKKTYRINQVKGITLDKTSLSLNVQGNDDENRILKATIKSADATVSPANPTVIWSTSNSNIAAVEGGPVVETTVPGNPDTFETTVTAHIVLKKAGSVTITATTQDGNKKAKCTVTIIDVPILDDNDPIIMNVGETHQLIFENPESDLSGITWTISNSDVVSVDKDKGILTAHKAGAVVLKLTKSKYVQQCYVIVKGDEVKPESYNEFKQKSGSDDDTDAIRNAIYSAYRNESCGGIYIPAGVYRVDATKNANYGIFLDGRMNGWNVLEERGDFEIRLSPGALILTKANSRSGDFHVITIVGCSNITISGGTIIGERNEHNGKGGESGHGIGLYNCTNTHISDMDISQCWGDGIYLGRMNDTRSPDNVNITITNCNVHDNRRNNLSITSAAGDSDKNINGVTIDNCQFNYAKGTDPQFGIDIETNTSRACKDIVIRNTTIKGNAKGSVGIITKAENVTFEDCELSGNFYNMAGKNVVLRRVKFTSGSVVDNARGVKIEK